MDSIILPFYHFLHNHVCKCLVLYLFYIELVDNGLAWLNHVGNTIKWLGYPNLSVHSLFALVINAQFWSLGRTRHRWKNIIKMDHKEIGWEAVA
jgi:hypothetical protein